MLHDIAPVRYDNEITFRKPTPEDKLIIYRGKSVLAYTQDAELRVPMFADLVTPDHLDEIPAIFLFKVGDDAYFLADIPEQAVESLLSRSQAPAQGSDAVQADLAATEDTVAEEGWCFIPMQKLIDYQPKHLRFALMIAYEYWNWYESSQFCGRCGAKTKHDTVERMMRCPKCDLMIFPKVFPAVIVAITRPDGKVLATRYAGRPYTNYALVAGFCEMGETVEQTVHREVMEEVGLHVKNLRYYKSQPWPDSSSLLFGFFCELDGSPEIDLDERELSVAEWVERDQLLPDNDHSLTREMMGVLRDHRENEFSIVS